MKINIELTSEHDQEMLKQILTVLAGKQEQPATEVKVQSVPALNEIDTYKKPDPKEVFSKPVDKLPAEAQAAPAVETAAPAAPAPAVETAAPAPAPAANEVELDSDGMPWDERIHTDKKTKVKAGTWKYKRGVDKSLVEQVEAEHRANGYGKESGNDTAVQSTPAVAAPQIAVSPSDAPAPAATSAVTHLTVLQRCARDTMQGKAPKGVQNKICEMLGVNDLQSLGKSPELFAPFLEMWEKVVKICESDPNAVNTMVDNWESYACQIMQS